MSNLLKHCRPYSVLLLSAVLAASIVTARTAQAAEVLTVNLDQAEVLQLPDRVATIVVGNPMIADASLQSGGMLVVTGKGYGATNLLALDRGGRVVLNKTVQVLGAGTEDIVVVYKGVERESYSCAPECSRRITLGDSPGLLQRHNGAEHCAQRAGAGCSAGTLRLSARITVSDCLTRPARILRIPATIKKGALAMNPGASTPLSNGMLSCRNRVPRNQALFADFCPPDSVRRFVRQQDGSAAVEFGMVAVPFLGLTFAILETALVFFAGQTLETAVTDLARLIMTGQAQTGGWSKEDFKNAVCSHVYGLFDCAGQMYVDVKTYTSFAAINQTPPVTNGALDPAKVTYSPGGVGDIEVVTLYYAWPIYVSLLGNNLADMGNNRLLVATAVFRNEPYQ